MLSCLEEGLSSCYVGAFNEGNVRKILGMPKSVVPVGIIPIGATGESPPVTDRLPIQQIVHWEEW
jgi:FMN reductase [NAD(P)H]